MTRRTRTTVAATAVALLVVGLLAGPPTSPAAASPAAASPAAAGPASAAEAARVIASPQLSVTVADDFPRVLSYTDRATGARLTGSTRPVTRVTLNGTAYDVQVKGAPTVTGASAAYTLVFPGLDGVELDATLSVAGRATAFRITAVRDTAEFRVGTLDIPGHDLLSAGPGESTAFTRLDNDSTRTADVFADVTESTPADPAPVGASYALLDSDRLAAAVETNSTYDKPGGATGGDDARLWHQARKQEDGSTRVGVWSGQWTYRGAGSDRTELPWAKVVVTPDANADATVDWQDAAVALRTIAIDPPGAEQTPDRVVTHIPFNFGSEAQHPFLRTLDDVKRVSLATDGLGQLALLKGYQSEGHDSAHPDYGGHYNERAGGLKDLNTLLRKGKSWGATFGVHINATESYPEAHAFSETLVDRTKPGWNWLNQSYYIDQRRDLNSGDLEARLRQLRAETDPNLTALYVDVYYTHGWIAERTAEAVRAQGWNLTTEWSDKFERQSLWSHWANDLDYGGATNKGLNSKIIRFVRNSQKDVWNDDPVLGRTALVDFEGWTGENDFTAFYENIWQRNLPAKFLQHQDITRWNGDDITFTGGLRATLEDGERVFHDHGRKVLAGDTYLLPWDDGRKLYHYNRSGGTTTWAVPEGSYTVYRLTDNGRVRTGTVRTSGGRITLEAAAGRPYVLYPADRTPTAPDPRWGEGAPVADPGFNDARLAGWRKTGTVTRDTDAHGRNSAALTDTGTAAVQQEIGGLKPGERYTASAWLEIEPGRTRPTTLSAGGARVSLDRSMLPNTVGGSDWHGTHMQRAKVTFTAPASGRTLLKVQADAGSSAKVRVDDVRVVRNDPTTRQNTLVYEDFEAVDQGWGPFAKGGGGGVTDARTHLALRNEPYTQAGWNGKLIDDALTGERSLKTHEGNTGLVYRTTPGTVPLKAGHAYRVSYDYQSSHAGAFEWVTGHDAKESVEARRTPIGQQRTTGHFTETVTAGCGDTWVGLRMRADAPDNADFVLDDFTVTDLGPTADRPACATLELAAGDALEPGAANTVEAVFTSHETATAEQVEVSLDLPEGWTAEPSGPVALDPVAPGGTAKAAWRVTPPADAEYRSYTLSSKATYTLDGTERTVTADAAVRTLPPPPAADAWASDLDWVSAENGWGPVERDAANGGTGAGDGPVLTVGGTSYAKGLGTHAPARVRYFLGGRCDSFTAEVGVDDGQGTRGSVRFAVVADGNQEVRSPVLRASDSAYGLTADVTGARYVDLVVDDGDDGNGNDHADWGNARFHCGT